MNLELLGITAGAVGGAMVALWLVSLAIRNASIVDIAWGLGFVVVAWIGFLDVGGRGPRSFAIVALTSLWGVRLSGYLAWRNLGHGEDKRYVAMREAHGASFWWVSLFTVFLFQTALILLVSLPLHVGVQHPDLGPHWLELAGFLAGIALFALGLAFETVGDLQLAQFKADPDNRGKVMDRGLWRYTRHPNYFGDFLVWWGLFLVCLPELELAWCAVGPLIMSVLLIRVSGVALLEKDLSKRPGYADYIRRTNAFFPWHSRRP